jgi:hypothetical protein
MQRVLQQHVRRCDFVNDSEIAGLAPKIGEPAAYDGLVVGFLGHNLAPWMRVNIREVNALLEE